MRQLKITQQITRRDSVALERYLSDISKISLLSAEEELDLARRIREQGDESAVQRLTQANLRFVVSVAKHYQNQGLSLSDLINEGNVGLLKAARRFDETRGFRFISYAVWWVRQSILQSLADYSRIIRYPQSKESSYHKVKSVRQDFMQRFEREPTVDELAEALEITPRMVRQSLKSSARHVSLDAPLKSDEGTTSHLDLLSDSSNFAKPDSDLMAESLVVEVNESLKQLDPREMQIVSAYYGLNGMAKMHLDDIGEQYGLTRERTRQIKDRALARLRRLFSRKQMRAYV